jgi:hypothetical protein
VSRKKLYRCLFLRNKDWIENPTNILLDTIATHDIRLIKLMKIKLTAHIARMEEIRNVHKILVGKHEGKKPLARLRIILKCILKKWGECVWNRFTCLRICQLVNEKAGNLTALFKKDILQVTFQVNEFACYLSHVIAYCGPRVWVANLTALFGWPWKWGKIVPWYRGNLSDAFV